MHAAVGGKCTPVIAQGAAGESAVEVDRAAVKADVVAYVVNLGSKLQLDFVGQVPGFCQRGVDVK